MAGLQSDLHPHDFLVRLHNLIANLHKQLESQFRLLRGQRDAVEISPSPARNFSVFDRQQRKSSTRWMVFVRMSRMRRVGAAIRVCGGGSAQCQWPMDPISGI
jgi:hypothetical protein